MPQTKNWKAELSTGQNFWKVTSGTVIIIDMPNNIDNPYNLPIHDQGNKNSCTSHAFAAMTEDLLSKYFKERTLVDVDDLWEKQLKYGTATEEDGDSLEGPIIIATKYGVRFKTDSGKTGTLFVTDQNKKDYLPTVLGWKIRLD